MAKGVVTYLEDDVYEYYPIGNTRSVDVTLGCQVAEECNILLLGCGDIRHVLHTMHVLHEDGTTKAKNQTVNFHINDIEDGILARDFILLYLAGTINPSNTDELKTLWAVWYDVLLSKAHLQKLKEVMGELLNLKSGTHGIYFGNGKTELKIKQALQSWLDFEISGRQTIDKRTNYLTGMYGDLFPERSVQRVSSRIVAQSNRMDTTERLKDRYQQEVREYITSGVSRANSKAMTSENILDILNGNVTFFRPGCDDWKVEDNSCPYMCYDVEMELDRYNGGETTMCSLFLEILKKWVESYQATKKSGCSTGVGRVCEENKRLTEVTPSGSALHIVLNLGALVNFFYLWLGDAIEVCEADMPHNLLFDFIDTSNIADRVGLIPVLICCQERLQQSNGVLRTETFHWDKGKASSLDSFLRQCLDVPQLMYPTVFGLHLAEELTLGHENILEDGSFVGVSKLTLRWKAAREQEILTLSADDLSKTTASLYVHDSGGDALSKCLTKLKQRTEVLDDTCGYITTKLDSKSKKRLMNRLKKVTIDEAPADSDISSGNAFTVIEEIDHYQVRIGIDPEFLKGGVFTTDMDRRDPYAVLLKNSRNGCTGFSKKLRFACGINIKASNIKLSRKRGTIEAHFEKDPSFTQGERLLPWKKLGPGFTVNLQDFPRSQFGETTIRSYVQCMHLGSSVDLQTATPLQQFQTIVLYLMKTAPFSFGVPTTVSIKVPRQADPSDRVDNRFFLEGLKIYENKPTMFLTFIDVDKMSQLVANDKISQEEISPFFLVLLGSMELDSQSSIYLNPGFSMLMQVLELNSYRRAQDYCQEPDKRWVMRTYLRARYPYTDYQSYSMHLSGVPREDIMKIFMETFLGKNVSSRHQDLTAQAPNPSIHSCDSCGRTSAECKKCSGCNLVFYCDRTCQRKAWPVHKHVCKRT